MGRFAVDQTVGTVEIETGRTDSNDYLNCLHQNELR